MNHTLAQTLILPGSDAIKGPLKDKTSLGDIVSNMYEFALPIAGVALLLIIISAGFTLLTSAGDAKKMEKGKQTLTYGVVGFVIIFLAYWITQLLGIVFGITAIQNTFTNTK